MCNTGTSPKYTRLKISFNSENFKLKYCYGYREADFFVQSKNMSNHSATSFPYGKEDSGLGASFFAKGVEEAMTSVGIYYADHNRHIFLQFCSTESSWQVRDDATIDEMVYHCDMGHCCLYIDDKF